MAEVKDQLTLETNALDVFDKVMGRIDNVLNKLGVLDSTLNKAGRGAGALDNVTGKVDKVGNATDKATLKMSTLSGRFRVVSSSSQKFASNSDKASSSTDKQSKSVSKLESALNSIRGKIDGVANKFRSFMAGMSINPVGTLQNGFKSFFDSASNGFGTVKQKIGELPPATQGWQMALMGVKAAIDLIKMGVNAIKGFINFSDNLTQTKARVDLVNDGLYTTDEVMRQIADSALRSGGNIDVISNSVAQLRANAGDVFKTPQEAIAFSENLNKIFTFSGTSTTGAESAMYNLTQAMSTGVFRGQDFNAVLANAPGIIQYIADEMNVPISKMREMANNGEISASIVRNALMNATDDINKKFDSIPMTFGRAFNMVKTEATMAFMPVNELINDLVSSDEFMTFIGMAISGFQALASIVGDYVVPAIRTGLDFIINHLEHMQIALLVLGAVAVAFGAIAFISFLIAHLPIILIILAVVALIDMFIQAGGTAEQVFVSIGGIIGGFGAQVYNVFGSIYNAIASVAEFLLNVFKDPVGSVKKLFADLAVVVLDILASIAGAVDAILGTDFSEGLTNLSNKVGEWGKEQVGDNYKHLERMEMTDVESMINKGMNVGKDLSNTLGEFNIQDKLNSLGGGLGGVSDLDSVGKVGSVGKIDEDVTISEEDLKLLKDIRQRDILVGITTPTPVTLNDYGDKYGENAGLIHTFIETMKDGEANVTVK